MYIKSSVETMQDLIECTSWKYVGMSTQKVKKHVNAIYICVYVYIYTIILYETVCF